ncbi:MAG: GntR family transcriptional regulator [Actinomycetota bacterium]|nr:GntR family transcriptional regulator [Actinomycetota bacterium]MEC9467456.1 GntR family transcriptional regulator [Actinomycetota bacterium]MED6328190.1 GntR family transcriptional regulator [Actinomycetota bacterium]
MSAPLIVDSTDPTGRTRRLVLRLDPDAGVPLYEQLRAQLSVMVAVGHLPPGSRLPTVRHLAAVAAMAPGTVARTYRELEVDGAVEGRGRRGTFVVDEPPHSEPLRQRRERLAGAADRFAFELRQLGVTGAEAHSLLDEALARSLKAEVVAKPT